MKRLFIILGGIVAVLALLIGVASVLVSPDAMRERIAKRILRQTGHQLTVAGTTTMGFLPMPHVILTKVSLTDPHAKANRVEIDVPRLEIDLNPIDILTPPIDARRVVFTKPVVRFYEGKAGLLPGHRAALSAPGAIIKAAADFGAKPHAAAAASGHRKKRRDIRLKDVRIDDGTLLVYGDRGQVKRTIAHIQAELSLPHIDEPLQAHGSFDLEQKTLRFNLALTTPQNLRDGTPADLGLTVRNGLFDASFKGKVVPGLAPRADGVLAGHSPSFKALLAWNAPATGERAPVPASLSGRLNWQTNEVSLSGLKFTLGRSNGRGRAALDTAGAVPHLRAAVAIDALDLTPFLPKRAAAADTSGDSRRASQSETPQSGDVRPPGFFVNPQDGTPPEPQAEAGRPRAKQGASTETLPRPPAQFAADINVNVHRTKVADLVIGPTAVGVALHDRVLTATLGNMQLYGGEGRGKLVIDGTGPVPAFTADLKLDHVEAAPLLRDAAKFRLLAGRAKVMLNLQGQGRDQQALKASLNGQGSVALSDGAVEGIDLTRIIAEVGKGEIPKIEGGATKFSDLGGSFVVDHGVAHTDDIKMQSPLLTVTAAGDVDIPDGTLNILAHPKIVAAPEGNGGANDLAGLTLPIRIQGPLSDPSYRPALAGLFQNPEAASKTLNRIGEALQKKFKGKPVGEAIGRFLGSVQIGGSRHEKNGAAE